MNRFPDIAPHIRNEELLREAIHAKSEECVRLLIDEGVSIHSRDEDGNNLLVTSFLSRHYTIMELLLRNGANPDECIYGNHILTRDLFEQDPAITALLLKYGASIHSPLPGNSTRYPDMGFLDVAISCGLGEVAALIINNPKYGSPTDEEIFGPERFDANQIFKVKYDETGNIVLTTPLHMCAATGFVEDQVGAIKALISNKADIHKRLPRRPGSQVHTLKPKLRQENTHGYEFEPNDDPEWTMDCIAQRSGYSLAFCLNHGVEEQLRNNKGLSGTERVLEILKYSGTCEFCQTLARRWDELIYYVEDPSPRLMVDETVCFPQGVPQDISV
ncbi:hypothetical protein GGR55DRAFT_684323 [Xylaria sp. FL0064]|nr:hypothetical protein GGR55DRAFT_684323 [Xylaria sp. FL0064]